MPSCDRAGLLVMPQNTAFQNKHHVSSNSAAVTSSALPARSQTVAAEPSAAQHCYAAPGCCASGGARASAASRSSSSCAPRAAAAPPAGGAAFRPLRRWAHLHAGCRIQANPRLGTLSAHQRCGKVALAARLCGIRVRCCKQQAPTKPMRPAYHGLAAKHQQTACTAASAMRRCYLCSSHAQLRRCPGALPPVRAAGAERAPVHGAAGRGGRGGRAGRAAAAIARRERAQRSVMARAVARRACDQQRRQPAQTQGERGRAGGGAGPDLDDDLLGVRLRGARAGRAAWSGCITSLGETFGHSYDYYMRRRGCTSLRRTGARRVSAHAHACGKPAESLVRSRMTPAVLHASPAFHTWRVGVKQSGAHLESHGIAAAADAGVSSGAPTRTRGLRRVWRLASPALGCRRRGAVVAAAALGRPGCLCALRPPLCRPTAQLLRRVSTALMSTTSVL